MNLSTRLVVATLFSVTVFAVCYFMASPDKARGDAGNVRKGVTESVQRVREGVQRAAQQNVSWFQNGGWFYVAIAGSVLVAGLTLAMGGKKNNQG